MTTRDLNLYKMPSLEEVSYPLDELGTNPDNLIVDEVHTVSTSYSEDQFFIIPRCVPFFANSVSIKMKTNTSSDEVTLKLGVDYDLIMLYKGGTRVLGKPIYGAISLNNLSLDGQLYVTYHTLGGPQIADRNKVLTTIVENQYNPRLILWDYVAGVPNLYPPEPHDHDLNDFKKLDDLVKAMEDLTNTVAQKGKESAEKIDEFLSKFDFQKFEELVYTIERHTYTDILTRLTYLEERNAKLTKVVELHEAEIINLKSKL